MAPATPGRARHRRVRHWSAAQDQHSNEAVNNKAVKKVVTVVVASSPEESAEAGKPVQVVLGVNEVKPGKYWLGVVCTPLDDELVISQLNLDGGLVVKDVVPDSPAAKAGLEPLDILTKVKDQPLIDLKVLVTCTEEAKTSPLALTIVRKGQPQEIEITPVERPAKYAVAHVFRDTESAREWKLLKESLGKYGVAPKSDLPDTDQQDPYRMTFVMPGIVLPEKAADFPKNLEVTITKKGEEPAKVTVKRGEDQWVVDADSLDKLPENIRPHIQRMLGQQMHYSVGSSGMKWSGAVPKSLATPKVLMQSIRISPDQTSKLLEITPELRLELREAD